MEAKSSAVELVQELKDWCRREELDDAHALMVLIPEDVANAQVEDALGTIKALGRVRVRGRTISLKLDSHRVLCESKEMVDPTKVPPELLPEGKTKVGGLSLLLKVMLLPAR